MEQRLLWISRRFTKKFHREEDAGGDVDGSVNALGDEVRGYEGMREVCGDVEAVLDVLWLCGTRTFFSRPFLVPSSKPSHVPA